MDQHGLETCAVVVRLVVFFLLSVQIGADMFDPPSPPTNGAYPDSHEECQPASTQPNWPTYHLFNNVTRIRGKLFVEGLNDVNAIFRSSTDCCGVLSRGSCIQVQVVNSCILQCTCTLLLFVRRVTPPAPPQQYTPCNTAGTADSTIL